MSGQQLELFQDRTEASTTSAAEPFSGFYLSTPTPAVPEALAAANRARIETIEAELLASIGRGEIQDVVDDLPLDHGFIPGGYARQMFIPAGTLLVGRLHKRPCFNFVMLGDITVWTEAGAKRVMAPAVFISGPGTKRVGLAHTHTVWVTVHMTDEIDPAKMTDVLTVPGYREWQAWLADGEMR